MCACLDAGGCTCVVREVERGRFGHDSLCAYVHVWEGVCVCLHGEGGWGTTHCLRTCMHGEGQ